MPAYVGTYYGYREYLRVAGGGFVPVFPTEPAHTITPTLNSPGSVISPSGLNNPGATNALARNVSSPITARPLPRALTLGTPLSAMFASGRKQGFIYIPYFTEIKISYGYESFQDNAPDIFATDFISWGYQTKYMLLSLWDYGVDLILQYRGSEVLRRAFVGDTTIIPLCAEGFKIKNINPGEVARYQISAFR